MRRPITGLAAARSDPVPGSASRFMKLAVREARKNLKSPKGGPFGAIHWARIGLIVYGTSIADAGRIGFNELRISNAALKTLGKSRIRIVDGFLRDECLALFKSWKALPDRTIY